MRDRAAVSKVMQSTNERASPPQQQYLDIKLQLTNTSHRITEDCHRHGHQKARQNGRHHAAAAWLGSKSCLYIHTSGVDVAPSVRQRRLCDRV